MIITMALYKNLTSTVDKVTIEFLHCMNSCFKEVLITAMEPSCKRTKRLDKVTNTFFLCPSLK